MAELSISGELPLNNPYQIAAFYSEEPGRKLKQLEMRVLIPHSLKPTMTEIHHPQHNASLNQREQLKSYIRKKAHIWTRNDKRPFLVAPNFYSWLKIRNNYSETTMPYAILNNFWRRG